MPKRKPVPNKHAKKPARTTKRKPAAPVTETTFPASEATPGQAKSRASFADLQAQRDKCPWWRDLLRLMQEGRFDWRKAAYIAWASSPYKTRWPATLQELCDQVLGCSDSVVHKWRRINPEIDKRVAQEQVAPLMLHKADVIQALITVAATPDSSAHSDRKLFLEMTGEYKPKSAVALTGENGGPVQTLELSELSKLSDVELDQFIANLETAIRSGVDATPAAADGSGAGSAAVDHAAPATADSRSAVRPQPSSVSG